MKTASPPRMTRPSCASPSVRLPANEPTPAIATVESVKASAEIYSPAGGKVAAVNKDLADKPESINTDPYGEAWMIQLEGGSAGDVMDGAAYEKYCEERDH